MMREGPPAVKMQKMDPKGTLKISKDGLEVENTGNYFETVRGDVKVRSGKWYYEVKLLTYGKIHIGWCTDKCQIQSNSYVGLYSVVFVEESPQNGIGNDTESWAFDGSSQRVWHGSSSSNTRYGEYWNNGDIIGTILDLDAKTISFYRNGHDMGVAFTNIAVGDGLYPACSLQKRQKVEFNFGSKTFKYSILEAFPDVHPLHLSLTSSQLQELEKLFDKYKAIGVNLSESGETEDAIKSQGFLQYGQDLGITEDTDPGLLIVCWKLNVNHQRCWEFLRSEFVGGWTIHGAYNIPTMRKKLDQWRAEIKNPQKFKPFYWYVFDYLREDKKILAVEEATTVWDMLDMKSRWPLFNDWLDFLKDKKAISRDTWRLFYNFIEQYPNNLDNYDTDGCWPSMIDEFVEYMQEKKKAKK